MYVMKLSDKQLLGSFTVISLITMGIGFYRVWNRGDVEEKEEVDELKEQEEEINKELDNLNSLQLLLTSKAEEIQLKYLKTAPQILTAQCLKEILEFTSKIVDRQQLESIYENSRKARRSCFHMMLKSFGKGVNPSLQLYYRFVCTFEEQLQYLIEKSQKDFVVFLNIQYTTITDSIEFHSSQAEGDFADWVRVWSSRIKQELREQMPLYQQPVPPSTILEIAKFQIQVLAAQGTNLKEAVRDLHLESEEEEEGIPTFLETFLEDIVHDKYLVEIEQTNLSSKDMTIELHEKFHILSQLKKSVLQGMIEDSMDDYSASSSGESNRE